MRNPFQKFYCILKIFSFQITHFQSHFAILNMVGVRLHKILQGRLIIYRVVFLIRESIEILLLISIRDFIILIMTPSFQLLPLRCQIYSFIFIYCYPKFVSLCIVLGVVDKYTLYDNCGEIILFQN